MKYSFSIALSALLLYGVSVSFAQNSPFSIHGLGLESGPYNAKELGMGNAGMGYVGFQGASIINPSKTGFTNRTTFEMMFETGLDYLQEENYSNTLGGSRIPYLSLNFQAGRVGQLGLHYFQRFDRRYSFQSPSPSGDIETVSYEGGSYEVFFSWGRSLGKYFALGASYNLFLGQDRKIIKTEFDNDDFVDLQGDSTITKRSGSYPQLSATFRHKKMSVALVGNIPFEFEETMERRVFSQNSNEPVEKKFDLPLTLGVGTHYRITNQHSAVLDVLTTDWDQKIANNLNRSWRVGAGYEFRGLGDRFDPYRKKIIYRAGLGYEKLYIDEVNVYKLTGGLGLPVGGRGSSIDLALEYGHRGSIDEHLVEEDYVKLFVSMTGSGFWGQSRRRR